MTRIATIAALALLFAVARPAAAQDDARRLVGHDGSASALRWSGDGKLLLVAGSRRATVFSVDREKPVHVLDEGFDQGIGAADLSRDGTRAAIVCEGTLHLVELASKKTVWKAGSEGDGITAVAFSPDGKLIATQGPGHRTHLWHADSGEEARGLSHGPGDIAPDAPQGELAFSPDGSRLLACGPGEVVRVFEVVTGSCLGRLEGRFAQAAWAPSGKSVAALAATLERIVLWEPGVEKAARAIDAVDPQALALAFRGDQLVTLSPDGVALREPTTGKVVTQLSVGKLSAFAVSPDGSRIAAGDPDGIVLLLDPTKGKAPAAEPRDAPPPEEREKGGAAPSAGLLEALDLAGAELRKKLGRREFPAREKDAGGKAPVQVAALVGPDGKKYDASATGAVVRALERSDRIVPVGPTVRSFYVVLGTVTTTKKDDATASWISLELVHLETRIVELQVVHELVEKGGSPVDLARPDGRKVEAELYAKHAIGAAEIREIVDKFKNEIATNRPTGAIVGPDGRAAVKAPDVENKASAKVDGDALVAHLRAALVDSGRWALEVAPDEQARVKAAESAALAAKDGAKEPLKPVASRATKATVRTRTFSDKGKLKLAIEVVDPKGKKPLVSVERELVVRK